MLKAQFVALLKKEGGYDTEEEAEKALKAFRAAITKMMAEGESVNFQGFGTFGTKIQKARKIKIPNTDRKYETKEKRAPFFRAGKPLKNLINEGE